MEFPEKEDSHNHVVCKQTHWPRSENWPLTETPSATPTAISGEAFHLPRNSEIPVGMLMNTRLSGVPLETSQE